MVFHCYHDLGKLYFLASFGNGNPPTLRDVVSLSVPSLEARGLGEGTQRGCFITLSGLFMLFHRRESIAGQRRKSFLDYSAVRLYLRARLQTDLQIQSEAA